MGERDKREPQIMQIDYTDVDVTIADNSKQISFEERPYLSALLDDNRRIVGWLVTLGPASEDALTALADGLCDRKQGDHDLSKTLVVDNSNLFLHEQRRHMATTRYRTPGAKVTWRCTPAMPVRTAQL
jgi:hypothetical protein